MTNSILFYIALLLCTLSQRLFAFQAITPLKSQLKVLQQNRLSSTNDNTPVETEKPRAETLADAYISPISIEPSIVTASDLEIAAKIKAGIPILNELQLSSIFGSTLTGLILGGISDFSISSTIEPWIAPLLGSLWFGGGSFLIEQSDADQAKDVVQTIFGKPTLTIKNKIQKSITNAIDKTVNAIVKKKNDLVNGIKAIPSNIKLAILASINKTQKKIEKKVTDAVDKVLESPRAVVNGIRKDIDDKVIEVKNSIQNQVDQVLEVPREFQVNIAKSINSITNSEPTQKKEVAEIVETDNAVQAIKEMIETEVERAKVFPKQTTQSPPPRESVVLKPVEAKLPSLSLNLPFGGSEKKEEKIVKKDPVSSIQKPALTVQSTATPVKTQSKSPTSSSSPFQSLFGGLTTYSKGTSSVTKKVTAATAKPTTTSSASPKPVTTQTPLKVLVTSKSIPESISSTKPAASSGGFLSFLASSPSTTKTSSLVSNPSKESVKVKVNVKSSNSVEQKEVVKKTTSSSSFFNFGGKSSSTASESTKVTPPSPSTKTVTSTAKPLFSTGSVKASPSSVAAASTTINTKPLTASPSKPAFSTGSIKTSSTASVKTNSKTPIATPSLLSAATVKTLKGYSLTDVSIATIDSNTQQFNSGKISARQLYAVVLSEVKAKDRANNILPYIIGSLPQGTKKLELNQYYQQIA